MLFGLTIWPCVLLGSLSQQNVGHFNVFLIKQENANLQSLFESSCMTYIPCIKNNYYAVARPYGVYYQTYHHQACLSIALKEARWWFSTLSPWCPLGSTCYNHSLSYFKVLQSRANRRRGFLLFLVHITPPAITLHSHQNDTCQRML